LLAVVLAVLSGQLISPLQNYHHLYEISTNDYNLAFEVQNLGKGLFNPTVISDPRTMVIVSGLTNVQSPIARLLWEREYDSEGITRIQLIRNSFLANDSLGAVDTFNTLIRSQLTATELENGNIQLDPTFQYFFVISPRTLHWLLYGSSQSFLYYGQYTFAEASKSYRSYVDYYDQRAISVQIPTPVHIVGVSLWVNNTQPDATTINANVTADCNNSVSEYQVAMEIPQGLAGWINTPIDPLSWTFSNLCIKFTIPQGVLTRYDLAPSHDYYELSQGQYNTTAGQWITGPPRHLWAFVNLSDQHNFSNNDSAFAESVEQLYDSYQRFLVPFADQTYFHLVYSNPQIAYVYSFNSSQNNTASRLLPVLTEPPSNLTSGNVQFMVKDAQVRPRNSRTLEHYSV